MTLSKLLNRPITIVRRSASGSHDDYGNPTIVEVPEQVLGEVQQINRSEIPGEVTRTGWTLFLPSGTDVETGDGVLVDDETFEVDGDPWHARNPRTQAQSHVEVSLRRVAGAGDLS